MRTIRKAGMILALLPSWFTVGSAQQLTIAEYPLENGPGGIALGPDGALWFTENYGNKIGRINQAGVVTEYLPPINQSSPGSITAGPDGALWFTQNSYYAPAQIGRITTSGAITEYPLPITNCGPDGITVGPDGALWFVENNANRIARITTQGVFTDYPIPVGLTPAAITTGPDGALWFTAGDYIGRATTAGVITNEYLVQQCCGYAGLGSIITGPDGNLWYTDYTGNVIGNITTAGVVTQYTAPTPPGSLAVSGGLIWFTDGNNIATITTSGVITEYTTPTSNSGTSGITVGPQGRIWFTEYSAGRVGEVLTAAATLTVSPSSGAPRTALTFTGSGYAPNETVDIYAKGIHSALMAQATADASGGFTVNANAPAGVYGFHLFLGQGQTGDIGGANFSFTAEAHVKPNSGAVGTIVKATGFGFGSGEGVAVYWDTNQTILGYTNADIDGTFNGSAGVEFTVPGGAAPGTHSILENGQSTGVKPRVNFTVN